MATGHSSLDRDSSKPERSHGIHPSHLVPSSAVVSTTLSRLAFPCSLRPRPAAQVISAYSLRPPPPRVHLPRPTATGPLLGYSRPGTVTITRPLSLSPPIALGATDSFSRWPDTRPVAIAAATGTHTHLFPTAADGTPRQLTARLFQGPATCPRPTATSPPRRGPESA